MNQEPGWLKASLEEASRRVAEWPPWIKQLSDALEPPTYHQLHDRRFPEMRMTKPVSENPQINYSKIIADTVSNHYNVCDEFKNNLFADNVEICKKDQLPFAVGIINVTGDLNVGMIIRTASLLGAEAVHIFGRKKFDKRSTVGAEHYIDIRQYVYDDPLMTAENEILVELANMPYKPILVEQGGTPIGNYLYDTVDEKPIFIFGSESHGIPQFICDSIPDRISIPQRGVLRSFNVSAAMAIVCFDYIKTRLME